MKCAVLEGVLGAESAALVGKIGVLARAAQAAAAETGPAAADGPPQMPTADGHALSVMWHQQRELEGRRKLAAAFAARVGKLQGQAMHALRIMGRDPTYANLFPGGLPILPSVDIQYREVIVEPNFAHIMNTMRDLEGRDTGIRWAGDFECDLEEEFEDSDDQGHASEEELSAVEEDECFSDSGSA